MRAAAAGAEVVTEGGVMGEGEEGREGVGSDGVSVEALLQFPRTHSGQLPRVCAEVVGDDEDGITFYPHLFRGNVWRRMFRKRGIWSFSW